ncbi:MAG: ChaN family lipoprotein [Deltaproteobacteria bacterium]|nr:ChaN family lipoprotein [Deltaproteobacteria bacterium]
MNRLLFLFLIFCSLSLIQSCATVNKSMMRKDPLIGKLIYAKTGQTIDFDSMIKDICSYDVIYLSEKHNNPAHHKFQEKVIRRLIEKGLKPSIGFEFFSMDDTPYLLNFVDSGKASHSKKINKIIEANLRRKLGWDTHTDKMWKYYFDLLNIAKKENLQVAGIDLSTPLKKRITKKGIKNITPIEKDEIFSTKTTGKAYKEYMLSIFKAVHCGMGNEKMQSRMYDTWIARNDKMALSITRLYKHRKGPVIIIIGGGHTEYGLGVIDRVRAIDKTIKQVNITMREISVRSSDLSEYLMPLDLKGFKMVPPADYLKFTQRVSYADPCEKFKKSLKKMKKLPVDKKPIQ